MQDRTRPDHRIEFHQLARFPTVRPGHVGDVERHSARRWHYLRRTDTRISAEGEEEASIKTWSSIRKNRAHLPNLQRCDLPRSVVERKMMEWRRRHLRNNYCWTAAVCCCVWRRRGKTKIKNVPPEISGTLWTRDSWHRFSICSLFPLLHAINSTKQTK